MGRLLTPKQLGKFLGLATQTIYNRRSTGKDLPTSITLGRNVRFQVDDVLSWMEHHKDAPLATKTKGEEA